MAVQYQSPAKTSDLFSPYKATSDAEAYFGQLHRWHASRFLKLWCWHAAHIQSPSRLIFWKQKGKQVEKKILRNYPFKAKHDTVLYTCINRYIMYHMKCA